MRRPQTQLAIYQCHHSPDFTCEPWDPVAMWLIVMTSFLLSQICQILICQRNSQLFRANLPSLTPAKFSSYTVSHNFWWLSNCHISTTYYTNKMILGTVQVLTFNPMLVMHTLQNAGYGPFSQIQSYNILELDFYMFKYWQPACFLLC